MVRKSKAVSSFLLMYQAKIIKNQAKALAKWRFHALVKKQAFDHQEEVFLI